jgi:hypothetical protein
VPPPTSSHGVPSLRPKLDIILVEDQHVFADRVNPWLAQRRTTTFCRRGTDLAPAVKGCKIILVVVLTLRTNEARWHGRPGIDKGKESLGM